MDQSIGNERTMGPSVRSGYVFSSGDVLGQYRMVRPLGKGGMGQVYEAEHTTLERRYALKLLPKHFMSAPNALERFKREAKVMANLEHSNIIQVDDFGCADGRYWLRMELAEGIQRTAESGAASVCVTLAEWRSVSGGRIPQEELLPVLQQLLEGLQYAHERGAVHRDLKPSNILLTPNGAKIADFGLVKLIGEEWVKSMVELSVQQSISMGDQQTQGDDSPGTSVQSLLGTYEYMSPEQKRGEEADERSDLYAVGLMAFKLLTGHEVGMRTPSQIDDALDKDWDAWVLKALEECPQERFLNAQEMLNALPKNGTREERVQPVDECTASAVPPDEETLVPPAGQLSVRTADLGNGVSMEFARIPAGSFLMGSETGWDVEKPVHEVTLSQPFWMAKFAVTQAQYWQVMGKNPSEFPTGKRPGFFKPKLRKEAWQHPVENVSWDDAVEFCRKLTQQERRAQRIPATFEYRLPTEAQWEYACRAGTPGDYAGNLDNMAWYERNSAKQTHPVGQKTPNAWGLYDMHGNVLEWCRDWVGDYPTRRVIDPEGQEVGSERVARGGCWLLTADDCQSANRCFFEPSGASGCLGFRPLVQQR